MSTELYLILELKCPEGQETGISSLGQILKILLDLPLELGRATPL
jgi:hypothetical protein